LVQTSRVAIVSLGRTGRASLLRPGREGRTGV